VNNPYGMAIGPDGAVYFCDLDNQRIRLLDLRTRHMTTITGNEQRGVSRRRRPGSESTIPLAP
jgi:streptogramin lyase